jgi:hypothetical protein
METSDGATDVNREEHVDVATDESEKVIITHTAEPLNHHVTAAFSDNDDGSAHAGASGDVEMTVNDSIEKEAERMIECARLQAEQNVMAEMIQEGDDQSESRDSRTLPEEAADAAILEENANANANPCDKGNISTIDESSRVAETNEVLQDDVGGEGTPNAPEVPEVEAQLPEALPGSNQFVSDVTNKEVDNVDNDSNVGSFPDRSDHDRQECVLENEQETEKEQKSKSELDKDEEEIERSNATILADKADNANAEVEGLASANNAAVICSSDGGVNQKEREEIVAEVAISADTPEVIETESTAEGDLNQQRQQVETVDRDLPEHPRDMEEQKLDLTADRINADVSEKTKSAVEADLQDIPAKDVSGDRAGCCASESLEEQTTLADGAAITEIVSEPSNLKEYPAETAGQLEDVDASGTDLQRIEDQEKASEEVRIVEKKAEELQIVEEKTAGELRVVEAEELRIAEEKAEEELRIAEEKDAEEVRVVEQKAEESRIAEEKAAEESRIAEEQAAEELRIAEEKAAEEVRVVEAEELRVAEEKDEEQRIAEEKAAEELRVAEQKAAEELRAVEAEESRIAEEQAAEELRIAEEKAAEEVRVVEAEELRVAEQKAAEELRAVEAEESRIAEEQAAEELRIAEEKAADTNDIPLEEASEEPVIAATGEGTNVTAEESKSENQNTLTEEANIPEAVPACEHDANRMTEDLNLQLRAELEAQRQVELDIAKAEAESRARMEAEVYHLLEQEKDAALQQVQEVQALLAAEMARNHAVEQELELLKSKEAVTSSVNISGTSSGTSSIKTQSEDEPPRRQRRRILSLTEQRDQCLQTEAASFLLRQRGLPHPVETAPIAPIASIAPIATAGKVASSHAVIGSPPVPNSRTAPFFGEEPAWKQRQAEMAQEMQHYHMQQAVEKEKEKEMPMSMSMQEMQASLPGPEEGLLSRFGVSEAFLREEARLETAAWQRQMAETQAQATQSGSLFPPIATVSSPPFPTMPKATPVAPHQPLHAPQSPAVIAPPASVMSPHSPHAPHAPQSQRFCSPKAKLLVPHSPPIVSPTQLVRRTQRTLSVGEMRSVRDQGRAQAARSQRAWIPEGRGTLDQGGDSTTRGYRPRETPPETAARTTATTTRGSSYYSRREGSNPPLHWQPTLDEGQATFASATCWRAGQSPYVQTTVAIGPVRSEALMHRTLEEWTLRGGQNTTYQAPLPTPLRQRTPRHTDREHELFPYHRPGAAHSARY